MKQQALDYAHEHQAHNLADLVELLKIPCISTDPQHKADIAAGAGWVADYCRRIGLNNVEIMPTPLHPVVYADWMQAESPFTLLIYGHYDVQPVDPIDLWHTPPFEPTVKGDDIFARGASDDKGQFFTVLKAVEAYLQGAGKLPINVKVLIEGEEEIGSPSIQDFLTQHKERFSADAIVICDHPMLAPDVPMMMYAVRGDAHIEVTVRGPAHDLHSGTFGGVVENPFNVLVRMLAQLQDPVTHRILVPGFYDTVRPIAEAEKAMIVGNPFVSDAVLQSATGAVQITGEEGYSTAERMSVRPTLEIHGMPGGFTGNGTKTVIPSIARAKISTRLVPDQNPYHIRELVADYLRKIAPPGVEVSIQFHGASYPVVVDYTLPAYQAANRAYQEVYGREAVMMRGGGSLPIMHYFKTILDVPIVMMGLGLPDDNLHAPNEKFHLPNFYRGIETMIHYFAFLA
jgi:acetylornithine deacetylase/succinyl-diaminopimelate desuccinylase-like protein